MWERAFSTDVTNLIAMIPLAICSFVMIAIVLERLFTFRPSSLFSSALADTVIEKISNDQKEEAIELVANRKTLQELILHEGMTDCFEKKVLPEVAFLDHGLSKLEVLSKWIPTLSFIAKVAPLLGLLGTVLGMIDAFAVIAESAKGEEMNIGEVAKGIGTALITTACGLMIAIPALITSSILTSMGEKVYNHFEDSLRSVTIASGGLKENNLYKAA